MKSLQAGAVQPVRHRMGRRVAGAIAGVVLASVALLGISAPAASAAPEAGLGWAYKGSFGGGHVFELPRSPIAVDGGGIIFGTSQYEPTGVGVYSPTPEGGSFLTEFSAGGKNVAVDPTDGTFYSDEIFDGPLRRYVSDGAPTPTYSVDPVFGDVTPGEGIAVDPTTSDLLVADPGAEGVRRYDTSGTLLETIATPSISPAWIVTAPDGSFYVAPAEGPDVTHFSGAGTQLGTFSGVGSLHGLAYDASRSLVVVAVGEQLLAYSPAGDLLGKSPAQGGGGLGLAASASGSLYEHAGGTIHYYAPGTVPGVEAPHVSALAVHSAKVSAEVDPGAGPPEGSVAHFEVSVDGGLTWPEELKTPDVPVERTGSEEPDTIEADLTGLKGNSDYLVRLVASNSVITKISGTTPFHTLLGPPEVETGPAISVVETEAELTGTIDTLGGQTTYHFEYGLTTSYGSKVPAGVEATAGNERSPRTFAREVSGLQPDTIYHYRLVAKNSAGEAAGADRTFTTSGSGVVRGYEQVSPRNKMGATVRPDRGFQVAPDGSAFSYQLGQAPPDAATSVMFNRVLSRRSPTGWLDWNLLDPPQKTINNIITTVTLGISSDFTHSMVVSNRVLTPVGLRGPYEDGGNIYIQNLETGEYTFIGGAPGVFAYISMAGIAQENIYMAGAPDFSWVIINSSVSMFPEGSARALYRWSREGGLEVESRLPDNSIATGSVRAPTTYAVDTYRQASDDGSVVYFSLDSGEGGVYRRSGGQTTAISVSQIPGDPDTVMEGVLDGASGDGRYAFFRSGARLVSDAPESLESGRYLYRYDAQSGDLEFIGVASAGDGLVWGVGDTGQVVYYETSGGSRVWNNGVSRQFTTKIAFAAHEGGEGVSVFSSPSGRYLAYYEVDGSVHLYDAEAEEEVCVSCGVGDGRGILAAGTRTVSNRHPEAVNDEGELYFDTKNPLVADDHNATYDVYGYHDGHLTLISPGDGPYTAHFGDATADGNDVFFTTDEGIAPGDADRSADVYDARIGGGFPETGTAAPECEGEACRPPIGGPPDLESPKGGEGQPKFAISNLRPLSSIDRKKLAKGGTARLQLTVSRPGTVTLIGGKVDSSPVKAKKAGAISVPFSLSKAALAELRDKGRLPIKLSVHFSDASPKVVHLTLNAATPKKGGRS